MNDRRLLAGLVFLAVLAVVAVAAPWLGFRDPDAQPDGLVLRDLPPLQLVVRPPCFTALGFVQQKEHVDLVSLLEQTILVADDAVSRQVPVDLSELQKLRR